MSNWWHAGANADIHSLNAPLLPQPAWELVRALNTLVDENRRILIDDWYEGLWELGEEEMEQLEANAARLDLNELKREWGIDQFALGRDGVDALKARAYEPTCNIAGLTSGYQGRAARPSCPTKRGPSWICACRRSSTRTRPWHASSSIWSTTALATWK